MNTNRSASKMALCCRRRSVGICSLLMASLFAISASFQFNDPDWYFWIPLYTTASVVNLVNGCERIKTSVQKMAKFALWMGCFLFVKVSMEDLIGGKMRNGFWSLDMRERVVREKFGSGLVIFSMFLQLHSFSTSNSPTQLEKFGMPILVGIAYGLSFVFFVFQKDEMRY